MTPPDYKRPFRLYIATLQTTIEEMLAQEDSKHHQRVVDLSLVECQYSIGEQLGLTLCYIVTKLKYYIRQNTIYVIAWSNVIKYLIGSTLLIERLIKWSLFFPTYDLQYVPQKVVKGQVDELPGQTFGRNDRMPRSMHLDSFLWWVTYTKWNWDWHCDSFAWR